MKKQGNPLMKTEILCENVNAINPVSITVEQTRHINCGQNPSYGQLPISAKTSDACLVEGVISR